MSTPLVFVEDLAHPVMSEVDRHHFERSLRMRPGESLVVGDGNGAWRSVRFGPELDLDGPIERCERSSPPISVVFAPVKGERPEWMVAKLTELGVDRIIPMSSARSVVRWGREHDLARLRRVAREAAMQSHQPYLPEVCAPQPFDDFVGRHDACLADAGGSAPSLSRPVVMIGPEGGWDDRERSCGLPLVGLGAGTLRAETAAVVAAALLLGLRGRLVDPVPHAAEP